MNLSGKGEGENQRWRLRGDPYAEAVAFRKRGKERRGVDNGGVSGEKGGGCAIEV